MSTDQYTPDELAFIDKALVGIANAYLSDSDMPASWPEFAKRDALALLEARRKIRGPVLAGDDVLAELRFANEKMKRRIAELEARDKSNEGKALFIRAATLIENLAEAVDDPVFASQSKEEATRIRAFGNALQSVDS